MTQDVTLRAEPRTVVGKKVKALRREGLIPGVVYGPVVEGTVQVSVEQKEFLRIYKAIGLNSLMTLEWDGGSQPVFIREVQVDPVRWNPLHIDFFAPNLRVVITSHVPVTLGEPSGDLVGLVNQTVSDVQIRGLPADLPSHLTADISGLTEPGQHVLVGDLPLPEGIELVTPADEVLVTVLAPTVEEEVETAEEAEAAEEAAEEVPATEASGGDDSGASEE
jgi:large subunit ribosomal protein L25